MSDPVSLLDLLHAAATDAHQHVIVHVRSDGTERVQAYSELRDAAERVSAALRAHGLGHGSAVIVLPDRSEEFLPAFWGVLLAGLVPVPLTRETEKLLAVAAFLDQAPLIVDRELATRLPALQMQMNTFTSDILPIDTLLQTRPDGYIHRPLPSDLAYLQFSSGSTGQPKGVELTHANVLANIRQIITVTGAHENDVSVSWMPYAHDMGLVCTHLVPLAAGMKQVKIGPLHFVRRPAIWFEVADRHQATILTAANFALMLVLKRVRPEALKALDLRSVRILANGSEPISPRVCHAFLDLLGSTGLRRSALLPVYGLAEACVGATFPPRGAELVVHTLDREALVSAGRAVPAHDGSEVVEITDLGYPLPGIEIRIVDDNDQPVVQNVVGHIQMRGPNVMQHYHRVPRGPRTFCDTWLRTGDLGCLINGRLAVTGRAKDVIVVSGRKYHAHDLEEVVRQVPGVRSDTVAICSTGDAGDEQILVFVGLEEGLGNSCDTISNDMVSVLQNVAAAVQRVVGREVAHVLPLHQRAFPRTTSGKIQRYKLRSQYDAGAWNDLVCAVETARRDYIQATSTPLPKFSDIYEVQVSTIWARVLGRQAAELGRLTDFRSLGGTSLQAMEVLLELEAILGRQIDPAVLLDRPTIADLADFVRSESGSAVVEPRASPRITISHSSRRFGRSALKRRRKPPRASLASEPVAVVGMACRFPGANTPEQFWENLAMGVDSVTDVPSERWSADRHYDPHPEPGRARSISKWGAFLDDVAGFDAAFFDIDPNEAAMIDPQQRILLEVAYEALERAGYAGERRTGKRIGVFVGVGEAQYGELLQQVLHTGQSLHPSAAVGNIRNLAAAHIARALNLNGPVMAVDTACSSALVALHLARHSIVLGECDLAIVGAANLNLTATPYLLMSQAGALSPTGRCRAFDAAADGFVPGEGAGAIVLASLANVKHEGDEVIGLVRGTAINNDGRSLSPMAPNPRGQQAVLAQAYRDAGIAPESVSYIEAHGTGTPIGDPIEIRSLQSTFPQHAKGVLRSVGSVKTNIGHLLNAAGMPALIKVLLQLQHQQLVPSLHYHQSNPRIALSAAGFEVPQVLTPWTGPTPLRAGINGFGFGGTNAHVILEAPPLARQGQVIVDHSNITPGQKWHLLTITARTETALAETARSIGAYLDDHPETSVAELCSNASTARDPHQHRAAAVVHQDLRQVPATIAAGEARQNISTGLVRQGYHPRVAFVFSGQGTQYAHQGYGLYQTVPLFAQTLDQYAALVGQVHGRSLLDWCYGTDASDADIARTAIAQPVLVAFEIALARLVMQWGLHPDAVVGHSIGEIAAAAVAGILPTHDALMLARERGHLMDALPESGSMAAVFASESTVRTYLEHQSSVLSLAAINGPREVVVAGSTAAVNDLLLTLNRDGIATRLLQVSHAFHSSLMEPMLKPFAEALASICASAPSMPFFSTVRGDLIDANTEHLDTSYWLDHVKQPVLFAAAIERLLMGGYDTFVEIGPGNTLSGLVRRICTERGKQAIVLPLLRPDQDNERSLLGALGRLWTLGVPLDRSAMEGKRAHKRLVLPTYPFEHEHYWIPALKQSEVTAHIEDRSIEGLFHAPVWRDTPLASTTSLDLPQRWLIIPDQIGIAERLCDLLHSAGEHCEIVNTPELASNVSRSTTYGIVHLRGCATATEILEIEAFDCNQERGVFDLFAITQTISALPSAARPVSLWVITSDAFVTGHSIEHPAPEHATLAGLAQALPDEYPGLNCRTIDLQSIDGAGEMARIIMDELCARTPAQAHPEPVAWRGGRRFIRSLRHCSPSESPVLRTNGVFLITGGSTGIGAELARVLTHRSQTTLILFGRTPLALAPSRGPLINELKAMGATVEYMQVDIGVPAEVEAAITHIINTHGPINGVVHAAGIVDPGSLSEKTAERFAAVLWPKVRGTWLLLQGLRQHQQHLDFFVACSSLASALPGLGRGLADYVAANAFLDAIAGAERADGRAFTSINWSVWAETGMGAYQAHLERMRTRGLRPLSTDSARRAFTRVLGSQAAQVVIADIAPEADQQQDIMQRPQPIILPSDRDTAVNNPIHLLLQHLIAGALRMDPPQVPLDESFMALGLDSLAAVDLVKSLERQAGCPLPLTLFFEYTTIRDLAHYLQTYAPALSNEHGVDSRVAEANESVDDTSDRFELTPVQRAFLVNHELYPDVAAFSFLRQTIRGQLSAPLLLEALLMLEARHPMLRVRIDRPTSEQSAFQRILPSTSSTDVWPSWFDVRDTDTFDLDEQTANDQFDLQSGPPFRVVLVRKGPEYADLLLCLHHIAGDGWSVHILTEELWHIYTRLSQAQPPELPPLHSTFKTYATGPDATSAEDDLRWWRDTLARTKASSELRLPYDGDVSAIPEGPRSAIQTQLDVRTTEHLREQAANAGLSVFNVMLATYIRCLAQWCGQDTITVNVAQARRESRLLHIERLVGCFADTLPIEIETRADESTLALGQRVRETWLAAQQHGRVSSYDLARLLPARETSGPRTASPASFSFARFPHTHPADCPVRIESTVARTGSAATRLALVVWEMDNALHISWNFPAALFQPATVKRLAHEYLGELEHLLTLPAQVIQSPLVCERILAQCARTPDAAAVRGDGTILTYRELDRRSSELAAHARSKQMPRDRPIGLLAVSGAESVIGILGIMQAGAPWMPLDPDDAPARLRRQLDLLNTGLVVCHEPTSAIAAALAIDIPGLQVIDLDNLQETHSAPVANHTVKPEDIAYVISTSGSTGTPKAVPITYAAITNYLEWITDTFDYQPGDRILQTASLCFDASISQILAPLMVGAAVIPVAKARLREPAQLLDFVTVEQPTIWRSVPSLWERVLRVIEHRQHAGQAPVALSTLRWICIGGEALTASLIRRWMTIFGDAQRIANHYGPTEATINATCYLVADLPHEAEEHIPIGRPIRGMRVQVCDEDGQPVPQGTIGEMYIGGIGLTPGYIGNPDHVGSRFLTDADGHRWYRSGDLVRERHDGELVYVGRSDEQVKIRGYRIEPGEIEAALCRLPQVGQAVVTTSASSGTTELVAFIEPRDVMPPATELRRLLRLELPDYMVPHRFQIVDVFPMAGTGKVDRRKLATIFGEAITNQTSVPESSLEVANNSPDDGIQITSASQSNWTRTERILAAIWSKVLPTAPSKREDDFFELGGDSLLVLDVFSRLEESITKLPRASTIYRASSLSALASAIDAEQERRSTAPPSASTPTVGMFRTTPAQAGFLLATALSPDTPTSWGTSIRLEGHFNLDAFERAVQLLIQRHPMLRVIFPAGMAPPQQVEIQPGDPFEVHYEDLAPLAADPLTQQHLLDQFWQTERAHRFNTSRWPLIRIRVYCLDALQHVWFVTTHHSIGDGLSAAIFGQELFKVYDSLVARSEPVLPALRSTFREYVELLEQEQAAYGATRAHHWRHIFATPYRAPTLWRGRNTQSTWPTEHSLVEIAELAPGIVGGLKQLASNQRLTPYVFLLTAFFRQLQRLTAAEDLLVGTAVSGRDHQLPDIMHIFGCFATALPLRVRLEQGERLAQAHQVATLFAEAQENQLPPQQIARVVAGNASLASVIGAQFFFSYMDFTVLGPLSSTTLQVHWDTSRSIMSPPVGTDLFLAARQMDGHLRLTFQGATTAFLADQLKEFAEGFVADINDLVSQHSPTHEPDAAFARLPHVRFVHDESQTLDQQPIDAALIGYLPPWQEIAAHIGHVAARPGFREQIRSTLFINNKPRLLEMSTTPLGRSGFVCIPWFADELSPATSSNLHPDIAAAVRLAGERGARSVSLAGMLPSLTGYGFDILRHFDAVDATSLTTGHALTVVSVVMTIQSALCATGRQLADQNVAFVGLGSIGRATLELLLWHAPQPRSLLLCDVPGSTARLKEFAQHLRRTTGFAGSIHCVEADTATEHAHVSVYGAGLIIGATSRPRVLDIHRLRPGAIVVDDSFPHCFDASAAIARMRGAADVLLVGGGLLDCGETARTIYVPAESAAIQEQIAQRLPFQAIASCQLEAVLQATDPDLPRIRGLVDLAGALQYWTAAVNAGIKAGPLHLQQYMPEERLLRRLRECELREQLDPTASLGDSPTHV